MKEYTTPSGNKLYYKVFYDLGGLNYFTYKVRERGYYLSVQRRYNQFSAFSDLSDPSGAIKVLLLKVNRQSDKQKQIAENMVDEKMKEIIAVYQNAGIQL